MRKLLSLMLLFAGCMVGVHTGTRLHGPVSEWVFPLSGCIALGLAAFAVRLGE